MGCGDVALRAAPLLSRRFRLFALARDPERFALLRLRGIVPIPGDLDRPATLGRLAGLAHAVLHFAPPQGEGLRDLRTAHLLAALAKARMLPQTLVYISTSGVYGDCGGEWVPETRPARPGTPRAARRRDAELKIRRFGRENGVRVVLLRVPGIYAPERLPLKRLKEGIPALRPEEDPYTNHIHAEDLARVAVRALDRGRPGRVYNCADDSRLSMGEYFDLVADRFGLPRPPRISWAEAQTRIPEALRSFMAESRRLVNRRMKQELKVRLRYPTVTHGISAPRAAKTVQFCSGPTK